MRGAFFFDIDTLTIRKDSEGRYCLNDLHKAAGELEQHATWRFFRNQQTDELIEELIKAPNLVVKAAPLEVKRGRNGGTFVVKELVYAYAMWISPAFHLKVIRTFDALVTGRLGGNNSGTMIGQATGLPTAQLVALQVQGWKIVDRLKAEKVPELRQDLYEQLRRVYADLGQTPPPLTAMGSEAPPQPEAATEFWAVYHALLAAGVKVNHSRNPELIAINLKQFAQVAAAHGMRVAPSPLLKQGLRESQAPRFMDVRTVNSVVVTGTIHCWVFEAVKGGAA